MRLLNLPEIKSLSILNRDGKLLFGTRIIRLFAYGLISVVLVLYLAQVGFDDGQIGLLLSLTLAGDALISLWITTHADRVGRRRMLLFGAGLMLLAGIAFGVAESFTVLIVAAVIGTISPSGSEVGPFLPIEQASLSQAIPDNERTQIFAWYNLAGSLATAAGALVSGATVQLLQALGSTPLLSYRVMLLFYALLGGVLIMLFRQASAAIEVPNPGTIHRPGLNRSRGVVFRLSALFALDSFGGGLVVQSLMAYWFYIRFGVDEVVIGSIFFGANIFAGLSALAAARIAARIGLINTMTLPISPQTSCSCWSR